jgi:hypothetical protein
MIPKKCCLANHAYLHRSILFHTLLSFFLIAILLVFPYPKGHCSQVTLTWDPNSEPDLAGYDIYYGTAPGNYQWKTDVGNVTTYTQTGLNIGATYYLAATAHNTQGLESGFSNEVVYTVPACTFSISPSSASFSTSGGPGSVVVTTQAGCNWGTSTAPSWITVNSGSGMGTGTMSYTVSPNTGSTRIASLTIAGSVFTITENGPAPYTITATAGTGGAITPPGVTNVQSGANQTYTLAPNSGYNISDVLVDGVSKGAIASYTFSAVNANHTINATFAAIPSYTLSIGYAGTGSGSVSSNPTGPSFSAGTLVTLTALPDANSVFSGWSGACSGTATTCQVTMNSDLTATATFSAASASSNSPIVATGSATSTFWNSETLNGTVNPNALSTTYVFQWGRTASYGSTTAVTSAGSGTSSQAASAGINKLRSYTVYYYRLVATNSAGTTYGAIKSFKTGYTGIRN